MEKGIKFEKVQDYINSFPPATKKKLLELRKIIKETASEAEECISYNMPAYKLNGPLIYFAGYSKHIGFYPTGEGINFIKEKLIDFKYSKGAIQFPLENKLPVKLIKEIVLHRIKVNKSKLIKKAKKS